MDNVLTLAHICNKIDTMFPPPKSYYGMKRVEFNQVSYAHSGAKELKKFLLEYSKTMNYIEIIEDFRWTMDTFACEAKTQSASFMFSVYCDVAVEVLDLLLSCD